MRLGLGFNFPLRPAAALVSKVRDLAAAYERLHVPRNRLVFALPATWEGTQAAWVLEGEGIATTVRVGWAGGGGRRLCS